MSANATTAAPTGRKKLAQDKERSDAALGHESQNTPSPEGAKENARVALGDLTEARVEQTGPSGKEFTYVDIGSIKLDTKRIVEPKVLPASKAPSRAKQVLKRGDVLVSMTRPNRNAVALVPPELDGAIGSTGFHVLRARGVEPGFLFYAVQTNDFVDALCEKVQGALYPAVRPRDISSFKTFLPATLPEQRRIVAEIEKQFTRLEAGVAALRRVQANLKRYRAAVLKAACEGCLVPAQGSWCFTELGKVVTFLQGLQVPVPDQRFEPAEGDVPFLRIVNYTQPDKDFRYITDPGAKYHVQNDDVVMVRYGTPGFVGRGFEGVIANNLFRVIPQPSLSKNYLFYFLKSKAVADLIRSRQKGGTMQAISFGQLMDIPISLPPLAEQKWIVAEVERRLSVVEELEAVVSANLQRATRLRQSILQRAFSGQL